MDSSEEKKAYQRAYQRVRYQRPEVKERCKARGLAYSKRPEVKIRKQAYYQRPDVKQRKHEYFQRPEVKQRMREYMNNRNKDQKMLVLMHYGGNPPKCACCGEAHLEFLSVDHINGGGNKHRKEIGYSGGSFFCNWLVKNNFPEGYQILCFNCNLAKGFFGYCPHQKEKEVV